LKFVLSLFILFATNIFASFNTNQCDQIINKKVFTVCYSYKYKGALAVWYVLDSNLVNKINIKKRPRFYSEKTIPLKYRSKQSDYKYSGYDRGHLANDADFDYSIKSLRKTYSMANIVPQTPNVNRRTWIKAEKYERLIARKLGEVKVLNIIKYASNPKRIGKNKIAVPIGFYKEIYNENRNFKKCFYYRNNDNINVKIDKLKYHLINCRNIK
jgi:endonuclease G